MSIVDLGNENGLFRVGWEQEGEVVAIVALERDGDDVIVRESSGSVGQLVDAIASRANAKRIVAADGSWAREIEADAPGTNVAACTLAELEAAIRASWSRETSDDPDEWTEENPARGQCAVTSLLVRELLGGEILVANVIRDGKRIERHAWNLLPGGVAVDLTREQFRNGEVLGEAAVEEPLFTKRHPERYELLASRVREAIAASASSRGNAISSMSA
jgi:hypothetical protein